MPQFTHMLGFINLDDFIGLMIPVIALLIPIVAILTTHQRKMAEIIHQNHGENLAANEVARLRMELEELKNTVNQHTIALDGASGKAAPPTVTESLQNRLGAGA